MINSMDRERCLGDLNINYQEMKKTKSETAELWKPSKEALKEKSDKTSLWAKAYVSLEHSRNN